MTKAKRFQAECSRTQVRRPVLLDRPGSEAGEAGDLEEQPHLPRLDSLLQRRLEHLLVILARQLAGGTQPDRPGRHVIDSLDHLSGEGGIRTRDTTIMSRVL